MKRERCYLHDKLPRVDCFPADTSGSRVAMLVQCPNCLNGQVSIYGENYGAIHGAALTAWNAYQQTMAQTLAQTVAA